MGGVFSPHREWVLGVAVPVCGGGSAPATAKTFDFLSRVSTLTRDIDIAILSVRLSVRQ